MKKYALPFIICLTAVMAITSFSALQVAAQQNDIIRAQTDLVQYNASETYAYSDFDDLSLTASSLSYTAVGCANEIVLYRKNKQVRSFGFDDRLLSIQLSDNYLYALFMKNESESPSSLRIYSIVGDSYTDYIFTGARFAKSIFLSGDSLYAFSSNLIHKLTVQNGEVRNEAEFVANGIIDRARKITGYKKGSADILFVLSDDAVYKIENNKIDRVFDTDPILNIAASDKYFALQTADKIKIYTIAGTFVWDKTIQAEASDASLSSVSDISIYANSLIVCDKTASAIKFFDINSGELFGMFAKSGYGDFFFNGASNLAGDDTYLYVADTDNNRVKVYSNDMKFVRNIPVSSPKQLCTDGSTLYVLNDTNTVVVFESFIETYRFNVTGNVLSISAKDDQLYVLTDVSLTLYQQGEVIKTDYAQGAYYLHSSYVGNDIFSVSANKIVSLTSSLSCDLSAYSIRSVNGMFSDYNGNLYLLCNRSFILKFERTEKGFNDGKKFEYETPNAVSIALNRKSGNVYLLSSSQNNVYVYERSALSPALSTDYDNFVYPPLAPSAANSAVEIAQGGMIQMYPDNYVDVAQPQFTNVVLLGIYNDDYYYVGYEQDKIGFIKKSGARILEKGTPASPYTTVCAISGRTAKVYRFPSAVDTIKEESNIIGTITTDNACDVLSNAAVNENGQTTILGEYWFEIEFGTQKGYVLKSAVMPCDKPTPVQEKYYGIVKAKNIGSKVDCFTSPDVTGIVALQLSDGQKVELAAPFDANEPFTKIIVDGSYYYVLSDNIILSGLTNGQLAAIIVVCVTLVAAAVVFTITFIIVRKRKKSV